MLSASDFKCQAANSDNNSPNAKGAGRIYEKSAPLAIDLFMTLPMMRIFATPAVRSSLEMRKIASLAVKVQKMNKMIQKVIRSKKQETENCAFHATSANVKSVHAPNAQKIAAKRRKIVTMKKSQENIKSHIKNATSKHNVPTALNQNSIEEVSHCVL